jgi:dihydrofolate reductase
MLLGRRSYEFLAARWPSRTGALADRLNSKPKYVVSSTLRDPAWNNSTVLKGDAVSEVLQLKQQLARATCASRRRRITLQTTMTGWPTPSGNYWTGESA